MSILDLLRAVVTPKIEWKRTMKRDDIEENQGLIQHKAVESFTKYVFIVVMIRTFLRITGLVVFALRHRDITKLENPRLLEIMVYGKIGYKVAMTPNTHRASTNAS